MAKKRILLVDDESDIVALTKNRLEANNYEVITAQSGKEALEKAKNHKPDLVLLDIIMHDMDGYEVCKKLKAGEETQDISVVFFTASSSSDLEKKCREIGAAGFIQKPYEPGELLELVKKTLGD
ncbi:MAG: response regulator [Candidatus Omnitrophica bacterium]|nr:response regulator [Candidatus Omnitrophota bacterium]